MTVWFDRLASIMNTPVDPLPPDFPFKASCPEVPILERYDIPLPAKFWEKFPKDRNIHKGSPFKLLPDVLRSWVARLNPSSTTEWLLEDVVKDIVEGADLKVKEDYVPTKSPNAKSAHVKGKWVTDTIALGIKEGVYCGPFDDGPKTATVNSIQTAPKHRGKIRIMPLGERE